MALTEQSQNENRSRLQKLIERSALPLLASLTVLLLFSIAGKLPPWERWYSPDPTFALQSIQLLQGRLALAEVPFGLRHDWVWSNGQHQLWGLGIPLIRAPFDLVSLVLMRDPLPDRLLLIFFVIAVTSGCLMAHAILLRKVKAKQAGAQQLGWLGIVLFSPIVVRLLSSRMEIYEETIFWGYFAVWGALAGVVTAVYFARLRVSILAAFACGLLIFIRPTLLVYGAAFVVALIMLTGDRRTRLTVLGVFTLMTTLWGASNAVRFGAWLEFGHALSVSSPPLLNLALKFGTPYSHEPFMSAVRELVNAAFFAPHQLNGFDYYLREIFPGQSETLRFRELYFTAYDRTTLILVLAVWLVVALRIARSWRLGQLKESLAEPPVVAGILSAATFLPLFFFYCWSPTLASRFFVDLAPAVGLALYSGWSLCCITGVVPSRYRIEPLVGAFVLLCFQAYAITHSYRHESYLADNVVSRAGVQQPNPRPGSDGLPNRYVCPEGMKHYNLNHATVGWNLGGDCRGEGATPLYLPATRCLVLLVSGEGYDVIRVKRGLSELTQRRVRKDTKGVELEYCEETAPEPGVEVYWFAWQDALKPTVLSSRYQIHSVTAVISDT